MGTGGKEKDQAKKMENDISSTKEQCLQKCDIKTTKTQKVKNAI